MGGGIMGLQRQRGWVELHVEGGMGLGDLPAQQPELNQKSKKEMAKT